MNAPWATEVTLSNATLDTAAWDKAIAAMAKRALFAAELLAGQMPKEIDQAFREAGQGLFPAKETDLQTHCSCPDWVNPCKHVAATRYVLGEAFDRDPFLHFELRGSRRAAASARPAAVLVPRGDAGRSPRAALRGRRRTRANSRCARAMRSERRGRGIALPGVDAAGRCSPGPITSAITSP